MKLHFKSSTMNFFVFEYMVLMGFLCNYIGRMGWQFGLIIMLAIYCFTSKSARKTMKSMRFGIGAGIIFSVIWLSMGILISGNLNWNNIFATIESFLYPFIAVIMVASFGIDKDIFRFFLEKNKYLINLLCIVNLIILTIQVDFIRGFMIRDEWLSGTIFYEDNCTGLFGPNGTHILTYFFAFLLVYNYYLLKNKCIKWRKIFILYNVCIILWMSYLSTRNDNISIFLIVPMFFILYLAYPMLQKHKLKRKTVLIIFACCIFIPIILLTNNTIINTLEEFVIPRINRIIQGARYYRSAIGGNERLAIVVSALKEGYGWTFGKGIGTHKLSGTVSEAYLGFPHFGINSMSSLITICGLFFFVFICLWFSWILQHMNKNDRVLLFIVILSLFLSSVYTVIFTEYSLMYWFSMFVGIVALQRRGENTLNNTILKCQERR